MRVALVFPPSLCLPNQLYHALPVLAGALKGAGHVPLIFDLNLLVADLLLDRQRAESILERGRRLAAGRERAGDVRGATELARMLDFAEPIVLDGEASKKVLRDPERFFHQPSFKRAFWNVVDTLGIFHQLDPIISPHRTDFAAAMIANQEADLWTPLHGLYEEWLIEHVLARRPEMIGVCVAFPEQAVESLRFARRLRERAPDLPICFGGPLITGFADKWLEGGWPFRYVDFVCIGDGEKTIVELADALEGRRALETVTNLVYRIGGEVVGRREAPELSRLDELPVPEFASANLALSLTPEPIYPLMTSRGCYWGRCTFCSIGWRENYRIASIDKIRADVTDVVNRFGARYVQIQDSSIPPRAAADLARVVREENLPVSWVAGMKFERVLLDPEYCARLAEGGCRSLLIGFESASQRLVDLMDKGVDLDDVPIMLDNLKQAGISAELLWFVGFPSEERKEALDTVRWLYDNRSRFGLSAFVSQYLLHPDTIVGERPGEFGIRVTGDDNDKLLYEAESGMQMDELLTLAKALAHTNNRTLVCNGSHVMHLGRNGPDLSGLERPLDVPVEVRDFCGAEIEAAAADGSADGPVFFASDFGFRSELEAHWTDILDEWHRFPVGGRTRWPEENSVLAGRWDLAPLWIFGRPVAENLQSCPVTARLLERVPGIYAAGFSMLAAGSMLPRHRGEVDFVLRAHLGLAVPSRAAISVDGVVRRWEPGKTLVFDDTLPHYAWNFGDTDKVILLVDFKRPEARMQWKEEYDRQIERDVYYFTRLFPETARMMEEASSPGPGAELEGTR